MVPLANDAKRLNRSRKRTLVRTSRIGMLSPRLAQMVTHKLVLPTCTAMKQRSATPTPLQTTHQNTFERRANTHAFGLGPHTLCQHACPTWRLPNTTQIHACQLSCRIFKRVTFNHTHVKISTQPPQRCQTYLFLKLSLAPSIAANSA